MPHQRSRYLHLAAAAALLAVGVGATAALVTVWRALTPEGLPYPYADRLVTLQANGRSWSPAMLEAVRATTSVFDAVVGLQERAASLGGGDIAEIVRLESVSSEYFSLLGVRPARGRTFTADEDRRNGTSAVAVVSDTLWRRRGADPRMVGRRLDVDGVSIEVIGVMPEGFRGLIGRTDLWTPLGSARWLTGDTEPERPSSRWFEVIGRLRPSSSIEDARTVFATEARAAILQTPGGDRIVTPSARFGLTPLSAARTPAIVPAVARVLAWAVAGLVLLIVINLSTLHLARADAEARMLAIRIALGADAWRIATHAARDIGWIAAGGAIGALAVRHLLLRFVASVPPSPQNFGVVTADLLGPDALAGSPVTAMLVLIAAVLGALPLLIAAVWRARQINVEQVLRRGRAGDAGLSRWWSPRAALLVVQASIACTVVCGGVLLGRSTASLLGADRGYDLNGVTTARLQLPRDYDVPRAIQLFDRLVTAVEAVPGVDAASIANCAPGAGRCRQTNLSAVDGRAVEPAAAVTVGVHFFTPRHLEVIGARLAEGRGFAPSDRAGSPLVAIVSAPLAARLWPAASPIGRTVEIYSANGALAGTRRVIGVLQPVAYSVDRDQGLDVYVPAAQSAWTSSVIFVRTAAGSTDVGRQLAAVVGAIDRRIALTDVGGMEALLARSISVERYVRTALLGFGVAALLVAMLGTWTLVAQAATRSRRELAIRAALGASSRHLAVLVARGGIIIAIAGAAAGATATWWWGSVLATLLRGMSQRDPLSLASGPLIIAVSILAAIAWPSLRAGRATGSEAAIGVAALAYATGSKCRRQSAT